jgi:hypothetical protein
VFGSGSLCVSVFVCCLCLETISGTLCSCQVPTLRQHLMFKRAVLLCFRDREERQGERERERAREKSDTEHMSEREAPTKRMRKRERERARESEGGKSNKSIHRNAVINVVFKVLVCIWIPRVVCGFVFLRRPVVHECLLALSTLAIPGLSAEFVRRLVKECCATGCRGIKSRKPTMLRADTPLQFRNPTEMVGPGGKRPLRPPKSAIYRIMTPSTLRCSTHSRVADTCLITKETGPPHPNPGHLGPA